MLLDALNTELIALTASAAAIAFVHTVLGPDHYLPFVALARSRKWSLGRALRITLLCGCGHIAGSVVLGFCGLYLGIQLGTLQWIEGMRGDIAAWGLVAFGLVYLSWGLRRTWRQRRHEHWHSHEGLYHRHPHTHHGTHSHPHTGPDSADGQRGLLAWTLFIVFVLGPCEPLIPLLMFPAARESQAGVLAVTGTFAVVTVLTMLAAVLTALWGSRRLRLPGLAAYSHATAGAVILCCGLAITVLGL